VTERLYYTDSYLTEFDARVIERSGDGRRIYLDRTAFYPTSGGQQFDSGQLGGVAVVDVVDEGDRIAHLISGPLEADRVLGRIDWARRFDHMQQHTGQHLLSAVCADRFGYPTVSVHFGDETSTLDLAAGAISALEIADAEARVNAVVTDNRSVTVGFESAAAAEGLRKASDREGTLRIVTIAGVDRSACGGTHVRATGEVGPILIRRVERVKQQVRLEFVCGSRAVRRSREDYALLARLAALQSAAPGELPGILERQRAELKALIAERRTLEEMVAGYRARELHAARALDAPGGPVVAVVREASLPVERLRPLAQAFAALPRAVFVGVVEEPPSLLLAAAPDSGIEAGPLLRAALDAVGGRGGGNSRMGQGSAPSLAALEQVIAVVTTAARRPEA
jgi:alanyl-tRNA synthetase